MRMTLEPVRLRLLLIGFVAAVLTVGCADGNALQSPTGPSGALGSATFLTSDSPDGAATASSAGEWEALGKGGNGKGNGGGKNPAQGTGPGRSHEDKVVGFVSAKTGDT